MLIAELFVLIAAVFVVSFLRSKPFQWTLTIGLVLLVLSLLPHSSWWLLVPAWCLFIMSALFANLPLLRQQLVTRHLIHVFRKVLPPMSKTEREALEAGSVWWEGELFQGRPNWEKLHAYPKPTLTEEENAFLAKQVQTLCQLIDDWQLTLDADLSKEVWDYIKQERFFSMIIPKEYGGLGFSALMQSTVVTTIATRSLSAAVVVMVPNSLGPGELLLHYGTDEQRNHYLPRLARTEEIPCFALTSTEGGSDAGAMPDRGVICKGMHEGKEVMGIRLNFDKRYITLAPVATLVGLALKLVDPDHLIGNKEELGITCVLLPADHPGVEIGLRHYPMYTSFMNGPVSGHDVFIPLDWVIGGEKMIGHGWRMLMECLSAGRGISLPALSTGVGMTSYKTTGAYSKLREQFKVSIGQFEGVQDALGEIAGMTYLLESTRLLTAGAIDLGSKPSLASAIAKYHMTEMCRKVLDHAMDIHAGRAIQAGPRNYLVNLYLHAPVAITVEGANILTRNLMIFGQGAVRCHPYVFAEMQALGNKDEKEGLQQFDKLFASHVGYGISNLVRTICLGISNAAWLSTPKAGPTANYYKQLTRMSTALALISDVSMLMLGGDLKRKESLSARMGDVLSYLYLASAALKYYEDHTKNAKSLAHVKWCIEYSLYQIQEAFYGVFSNFTQPAWGCFLKCVIFPWGRSYKMPSDQLVHELAKMTMVSDEFRDEITHCVFVGKEERDPILRIERTFQKFMEVEPLLKKIHKAMHDKVIPKHGSRAERLAALAKTGVLTPAELASVKEFEAMRFDVMSVDNFPAEFFKKRGMGK